MSIIVCLSKRTCFFTLNLWCLKGLNNEFKNKGMLIIGINVIYNMAHFMKQKSTLLHVIKIFRNKME